MGYVKPYIGHHRDEFDPCSTFVIAGVYVASWIL